MNYQLQERWVKALQSGKYEQGTGELRTVRTVHGEAVNRFCCLGVYCNLLNPNGWDGSGDWRDQGDVNAQGEPKVYSGGAYRVPGISERDATTLARFNDSPGVTFEQIALLIRGFKFEEVADGEF